MAALQGDRLGGRGGRLGTRGDRGKARTGVSFVVRSADSGGGATDGAGKAAQVDMQPRHEAGAGRAKAHVDGTHAVIV
jgi:hypothetical protein